MAAKELFKVRIKFVDKVRFPVLNQILDHLLLDEVLNDQEKNSILDVNCSNADKARNLIDTVRSKGDGASQKMIGHIKDIDKHLYGELFPQNA